MPTWYPGAESLKEEKCLLSVASPPHKGAERGDTFHTVARNFRNMAVSGGPVLPSTLSSRALGPASEVSVNVVTIEDRDDPFLVEVERAATTRTIPPRCIGVLISHFIPA